MIFLRLACLMAGILVLVAPPTMLFPNGAAFPDLSRSAALLAAMLLASASFFFIGMTGHRIKHSPKLARLCLLVLLVPLLAGAAMLWGSAEPAVLWMSGVLLGFTLIVALALALPLLSEPSARRLRAREGRQSQLPALRHG
jgi:hypothetical protein